MDGMRDVRKSTAARMLSLVLAAMWCSLSLAGAAQPDQQSESRSLPPEMRWHRVVAHKDGDVLYHLTAIVRFSDTRHESILLIRDLDGEDAVYRDVWTYGDDPNVTARFSTVDGRSFMELSWVPLVKGKSRVETMKELRENEVLLMAPIDAHFSTNGGSWAVLEETHTRDADYRRKLARDSRLSANATLIEMLERMRGTLFDIPDGVAIHSAIARYVLYELNDVDLSSDRSRILVRDDAPDCEFDDAFGYPCTDSQKERIAAAQKAGKSITGYW